jgi:squalene-associated FAD-dependent desaturase
LQARRRGHEVLLLEAARQVGGRARRLDITPASQNPHAGSAWALDNGQHILIGAYRECLQLMRELDVAPEQCLRRLPLALRTPDGAGLAMPAGWPPQLALWAVLAGVLAAQGWRWRDKLSLLQCALGWQRAGFDCPADWTVARLCRALSAPVFDSLIEPLCVSALNTPAERASGQVFLRVMKDALFGEPGGADLLLPLTDLSALLPDAAVAWLRAQGQECKLGARVQALSRSAAGWTLLTQGQTLHADAVLLACPATEAARLLRPLAGSAAWVQTAEALQHEAIATVYAWSPQARLPHAMLALRADSANPAQFVFDRGQLGGPAGLLAFVVSASRDERAFVAHAVLAQAQAQLGLTGLEVLGCVVEKRATFACTPGLLRPGMQPLEGEQRLLVCGDYVAGPYPATLEGAVRSGLAAARGLPL